MYRHMYTWAQYSTGVYLDELELVIAEQQHQLVFTVPDVTGSLQDLQHLVSLLLTLLGAIKRRDSKTHNISITVHLILTTTSTYMYIYLNVGVYVLHVHVLVQCHALVAHAL